MLTYIVVAGEEARLVGDAVNWAPVLASLVSLSTMVILCSWCYNCWKKRGPNGKDSGSSETLESSSESLSSTPSHKYRTIGSMNRPLGNVQPYKGLYNSRLPYDSPDYMRKSLKFNQPPTQEFGLQTPQPDVAKVELPAAPPPPQPNLQEDLGKLYFSLNYSSHNMVLTLKILKATNLPAKDFSGTSDPFVKIMLLPDKKHKLETRVKRKNLNPVWNEVFTFEGFPHNKLLERTLYMEVLDYDRFSRNDPIGEIEIPLENIDLGPITLTFTKDLLPCKKDKVPLGDLLVSLMYQPTSNRVVVVVMKANKLKAMDIIGSSDPYVKIYVMHKERRLEKKKTTIKRRTRDPVWNESFIFEVQLDKIRDLTLVCNVMDYDRITQNELIGQVILGYRTTGSSLRHWTEMMNNPRKPIAQWHRLQQY